MTSSAKSTGLMPISSCRWKSSPADLSRSTDSGANMSSLQRQIHIHIRIQLAFVSPQFTRTTHARLNRKLNCHVQTSGGYSPDSSARVMPIWMILRRSTLQRMVW